MKIGLLLLLVGCCFGQGIPFPGFVVSNGGGSISVFVHGAASSSDGSLAQMTAINSTTGTLLVCATSSSATSPPSDSIDGGATWTANTWTLIKATSDGAGGESDLYYVNSASPTVGASHLFRVSTASKFPSIACFAAKTTTSILDGSSVGAGTIAGTSLNTGNYTPGTANAIVFSSLECFCTSITNPPTSTGGTWTVTDFTPAASALAFGTALAYSIQTTAVTENVLWTPGALAQMATNIIGSH